MAFSSIQPRQEEKSTKNTLATNHETPKVYNVETHVPIQPGQRFWVEDLTLADREVVVHGKDQELINNGSSMPENYKYQQILCKLGTTFFMNLHNFVCSD